jgi:uncharacterized oligopeptide transporter (OPT) family protein
MLEGVKASLSTLSRRQQGSTERTDQDMSPRWIIVISLAMIALLAVVFASFFRSTGVAGAVHRADRMRWCSPSCSASW